MKVKQSEGGGEPCQLCGEKPAVYYAECLAGTDYEWVCVECREGLLE